MTERSAPLDGEPGAEVIHIVNQMKQQIVLGRLKPRERLTEDDLCLQFGASRHLASIRVHTPGASRAGNQASEQGSHRP